MGRIFLVLGHCLPCMYLDLGSDANSNFNHVHSGGNVGQGEGWLHMEQSMISGSTLYTRL